MPGGWNWWHEIVLTLTSVNRCPANVHWEKKTTVLKAIQIVSQYISHCLPTLLENICSQMKKLQHFWKFKTTEQKRTLYTSVWAAPLKGILPAGHTDTRGHMLASMNINPRTCLSDVSDHPVLSTKPTYAAQPSGHSYHIQLLFGWHCPVRNPYSNF